MGLKYNRTHRYTQSNKSANLKIEMNMTYSFPYPAFSLSS